MVKYRNLSVSVMLLVLFCSFTPYVNVGKDRQIMQFEAGNKEYCNFLNNIGSNKVDSLKLYSPLMSQHFMGGIEKVDKNGKIFYHVKAGYENMPVSAVTWESAIRFINWLHYNAKNIRDNIPTADFLPLTEGDGNHGAYNTKTWTRNKCALYWLPSKQEWLLALYFDGKNIRKDFSDENANVYCQLRGWHEKYPHIRSNRPVGRPSHYGTYNQQGNLAEWVEDKNGEMRLALGGSLIRPAYFALYGEQEGDFQDKSIPSFGFRVCRNPAIIRTLKENPKAYSPAGAHKETVRFAKDRNGGTYVFVGNKNNPGDAQNGFKGSVRYDFWIARCELSNAEYCRFLNAVASQEDKYRLYNPNMGTGIGGGIIREKDGNGKISYKLKSDYYGKFPVVYIGFYELARYCNWLHYNCPSGRQVIGVTEGDSKTGAYDTSDFEAVRSGKKKPFKTFGKRNKGAKFWIPNGDEWYKAAYFDPRKIGSRPYHDYPTGTDDAPTQAMANYMHNSRLAIGAPGFYAPVDSFANAPSPFGTLQQGGNVWEWTESWQYGATGTRALRGGSWQYTEYGLNAVNEDPGGINDNSYLFGGRIAMAASPQGYEEIKEPVADRIYHQVMKASQNSIVAAVAAISLVSVIAMAMVVILIIRSRKRNG